jgi:Family of unknown function (DUF5762)
MNTFWTKNPTILFNKQYITQLWPSSQLNYDEKMNAITRLVLLLSILGYIFTMNLHFLIVGVLTIIMVCIIYGMNPKRKLTKEGFMEFGQNAGLDIKNNQHVIDPSGLPPFLKENYLETKKKNPLGNVLMTDYTDDPKRKSAPPSFNTEVYENINNATKKMIQTLNPGIKNTNKQLFGGLGEKFEFDQSQWYYYSTPNTKIPNDQGAYADYLYGYMPSAREGNPFALVQDNIRYNLY